LLLAAYRGDAEAAGIATRLEHLGETHERAEDAPTADTGPLRGLIEPHVSALEAAAAAAHRLDEARHAVA
jgi:hypothetical protein